VKNELRTTIENRVPFPFDGLTFDPLFEPPHKHERNSSESDREHDENAKLNDRNSPDENGSTERFSRCFGNDNGGLYFVFNHTATSLFEDCSSNMDSLANFLLFSPNAYSTPVAFSNL
jgi:hypothetical protein